MIGDLWHSISTRMAANPELDILPRRAILDVMQELASEPADVTYQEIVAAGQQALWVNPLGAAPDRVILFLHGGVSSPGLGFVVGVEDAEPIADDDTRLHERSRREQRAARFQSEGDYARHE